MTRNHIFTCLYFVVGGVELAGAMAESRVWVYIFKPLLMLLLWAWSWSTPDERYARRKIWFQAGLLCACLGDVFLMLDNRYFLPGLGAFWLMQGAYLVTFLPECEKPLRIQKLVLVSFPLLLFLAGVLREVLPRLEMPAMRVAVPVYAFTIAAMAGMALLRSAGVSSRSRSWVGAGAVLFLISDTFIAWDTFVAPLASPHFLVMGTYIPAQFAIVKGMLKVR